VVLWNHRWEYDKNPDLFFRALLRLDLAGVEFRLVVLGESFRDSPPIFEEARQRLSHRLLHWGFAKSIEEYWEWLYRCDVVVSTSLHEFFGVSVVEGIAAGCFPLLPLRLSYPELLPESLREVCYYRTDKEFEERLTRLLTGPLPSVGAPLAAAAQRFLWPTRIQGFDRELEEIVALALHRPVE
jgi:glycosyltransferase involved in cell wall biosynthesis